MTAHSRYNDMLGVESAADPRDDVHAMPYDPKLRGRTGFLHGGAIASLLIFACDSKADEEGGGYDSVTSSMNFVRGGREQGTYARSRISSRTARFLTVEATAWQESEDKPIAVMNRIYMRRA